MGLTKLEDKATVTKEKREAVKEKLKWGFYVHIYFHDSDSTQPIQQNYINSINNKEI